MSAPIDKDRLDAAAAAYVFGVMPGDESEATEEELREFAQRVLDASGYPAEVERLREVLKEAKRLLAVIEQYSADLPLDVHHGDIVALDSAVYRAEQALSH